MRSEGFLQDRREARHSWEVTGVNEMLTQMESFAGIFIASTNLQDSLDQASLRRFDMKIKFHYLQQRQSRALLESYCNTLNLDAPGNALAVRLGQLNNVTPGDFAAIIRRGPVQTFLFGRGRGDCTGTRVQPQGKLQTPHRVLLILSKPAKSQCGV